MEFPDVMVDLETTGLSKSHNNIIQIAAVKFNLKERTISHDFFDRALLFAPNRYWDEDTRMWWAKRQEVLKKIWDRMEEPLDVIKGLTNWAGPGLTFWGKPTHFDHTFLDSYYQQFGLQIPFHYRQANDMNSFIRARYWPETPPQWEKDLPFTGEAHNALHDTLHQIKVLFKVADETEVQRVE